MKCIYVGSPFPDYFVLNHYSRQEFSQADNKAQLSLLRGLKERYRDDLIVITSNQNFENKKNKKIIFGRSKVIICDDIAAIAVANINLDRTSFYFTTMIMMTIEVLKIIKKLKKKNKNEKIVVVSFNPHIFYSYPVLIAKKRYSVKTVCFLVGSVLLPDLTGLAKFINKRSLSAFRNFDGVITYVEKSCLDYTKAPYLPILYSVNHTFPKKRVNRLKKEKVISYTGALTTVNGVDIILEVAKKLPVKYKFIICGTGPLKERVLEYEKKYDNIIYKGVVSNEESMRIQQESDLLLLIRSDRDTINKYYSDYAASGKLTQYVATGVPILAHKIGAFPSCLIPYLNFVDSLDPNQIAHQIEGLLENDSYKLLLNKAEAGKKFIEKNGNESTQNKKICDFVDKLMKR